VTPGQYGVLSGTVNGRGVLTEVHEAALGPALGMSSKGDIPSHNGSDVEILPVGSDGMVLMADSGQSTGLVYDFVDHNDLLNKGTNSHAQIDSHIADATIHYVQTSIDHANLINKGTNSHAQIDTHIANNTIHFTEASINHNNILNKGTNTHSQIDSHIASTSNPHSVTIAQVSPLTTKGDVMVYGSSNVRLPVGSDGQILTADSAQTTGVAWTTPMPRTYLAARTPTAISSNILTGWTTVAKDSASTFDGQTYTVPSTGEYEIHAQIPIGSSGSTTTINAALRIFSNGSSITTSWAIFPNVGVAYTQTMSVFRQINLTAGDLIDIRLFNISSPLSLLTTGTEGQLSITRYA
jgi:hypothetical protein